MGSPGGRAFVSFCIVVIWRQRHHKRGLSHVNGGLGQHRFPTRLIASEIYIHNERVGFCIEMPVPLGSILFMETEY